MLLIYSFTFTVTFLSVLGDEIDTRGILIYEDLGCTAVYSDNKKTPVKYTCQGLDDSDQKCYFRGKSYGNRETVASSLSVPSCDQACVCLVENGSPKFTCAILDCPEWLGVPVKVGCYRNYSLDECCSIGQICPPFNNSAKCIVEGKEYREGERFYPSNTCLDCVCLPGFEGKFEEPFCRRRLCGQQLRNSADSIKKSCAPFYTTRSHSEVLCCPDDWICHEGEETITGDAKSEEICKFGDKTLKVGQRFAKTNITDKFGRSFDKVECECDIPPFVRCRNV